METKTINTLSEFTKYIEESYLDQDTVLFRGQANTNWKLKPLLARLRLTDDILKVEKAMIEEFQRYSVPYLKNNPETVWDWVSLAQHHGLPTRMLDWTLNPFSALWFAVNNPVKTESGVVWIFKSNKTDFAKSTVMSNIQCKKHLVFRPKHITERITAQLAYFTVHKGWSKEAEFEPLEESNQMKNKLTKLIIPRTQFAHCRFHLDRFGINDASIFPGLDGLCKHIKWTNCFLSDEGDDNYMD